MNRRNLHSQTKSVFVLQILMGIICLIILGRVFQLQILEYENYEPVSKQNSLRQEIITPARGLIYDRNGVLLVDNQPIYTITVTPSLFDKTKIPLLAELSGVSETYIDSLVNLAQKYSWHRNSRLFHDIDFKTFSLIQENIWQLPGINHLIESKRNYPADLKASHIFGYLREASEQDISKNQKLNLGEKIGKSGLEGVYQDYLRGESGIEYLRVNAFGQTLGTFQDEELSKLPKKGDNIQLTIDSDLQRLAEKLMQGKRGAVIALDPKTGAVLAMVSSPQFDISRLAGKVDNSYWLEINTDSTTPLYNRAVSTLQPPGSTFKPLMGLTGVELGIITPKTQIYNSGAYVRGRAYADHLAPVGNYDLEKAITYSSNTYFYSLMDKIATQGKLNRWKALINDFGLGISNDIDLPSETVGIIPDSARLDRMFGKAKWSLGDVINLGIGQGVISASPLQIAVMTAAIANDGYKVKPYLTQSIISADGEVIETEPELNKINWIDPEALETVKRGMRGVVTIGSGRFYANHPSIPIAGKTGTAQNPHGQDHGWFTSFAPLDDPQIVVTAYVENAGFGSTSAAPIAALLIEQFIQKEIKRTNVLQHVLTFKPKPVEEKTGNE